jgi:hypothetical protein
MSEKCSSPDCGRPSKGSIGMLRYCYACFAALLGWEANDPRLRRRGGVALTDDGRHVGEAEWVPDVAISRERQRTSR